MEGGDLASGLPGCVVPVGSWLGCDLEPVMVAVSVILGLGGSSVSVRECGSEACLCFGSTGVQSERNAGAP
jgi:hypothetical protein